MLKHGTPKHGTPKHGTLKHSTLKHSTLEQCADPPTLTRLASLSDLSRAARERL